MYLNSLTHHSHLLVQASACNHKFIATHSFSNQLNINVFSSNHQNLVTSGCIGPAQELVSLVEDQSGASSVFTQVDEDVMQTEEVLEPQKEAFSTESIWSQMAEIVKFSGPAVGLWLCGPLMSLIDTAVVGQESSIELAALGQSRNSQVLNEWRGGLTQVGYTDPPLRGPGTVLCDHTSYVFMFLSVATSNFVATALVKQDKGEVQRKISILMFLGLACGSLMLVLTRLFGLRALSSFTGASKGEIIYAANTYVQIRALAWPAVLFGSVAQSASLGMKDSFGPLKALAVASAINGIGDIVLCRYFNYGIAGAAWATLVSQVVAGFMMVNSLNKKGYNGYALSVPSYDELTNIFMIAAPVFVTMMSKVLFYSLLIYFATSMGTHTVAAHQVMIQLYCMFAVWAEPLSQTAQSFMPELLYGENRSLSKARTLLKSLVIIGTLSGLILGALGTSVPWFFPKAFSSDHLVIQEMVQVSVPFFLALCVAPSTLSMEGTLLAGRDLKFISLSMSGIFCLGSLLVLILTSRGCGLAGCWFTLAAFQWSRFLIALQRLTSPTSLLYSDTLYRLSKLSTA